MKIIKRKIELSFKTMSLEQDIKEEFAKFLRDNWEDRERLDVAGWWLEKLSDQKKEIVARAVSKIHVLWNYPCTCDRKNVGCVHNFSQMESIINSITSINKE